jgi:hypothetical protein
MPLIKQPASHEVSLENMGDFVAKADFIECHFRHIEVFRPECLRSLGFGP